MLRLWLEGLRRSILAYLSITGVAALIRVFELNIPIYGWALQLYGAIVFAAACAVIGPLLYIESEKRKKHRNTDNTMVIDYRKLGTHTETLFLHTPW